MLITKEEADEDCRVCSRTANGFHFGAYVCRPCGAFFRRIVLLKKESSYFLNYRRSYRFKKCLSAGMKVDLVQPKRDQIGRRSFVEKAENEQYSVIDKIYEAYKTLENERKSVHNIQEDQKPRSISFSELKTIYEKELRIIYLFLCDSFQEYSQFSPDMKRSTFKNVFLPIRLLESAYFGYINDKPDVMMTPSGGYVDLNEIDTFYSNEENIFSKEESCQHVVQQLRMFKNCLCCPMKEENIEKFEFLALIGLLLWERDADTTYENEPSPVNFHQVRDAIIRDLLHYYQSTKTYPDPTLRLAKILSFLPLVQRCTHKFQEFVEMKYLFDVYTLPRNLYDMSTPTT